MGDAADALALARALIRCPSVTPEDAGAQAVLAARLTELGFAVTALPFGTTPNLFARVGTGRPFLLFAGHTDVVPPGGGWRHDPFGGAVEDGVLYGRGACDMKGAIAAFVAAAARHLAAGPPRGSIGLLITGDEEGPAADGTVRMVAWMAAHGQLPDACIVGEPSCAVRLGDMVKVGRRGSLNVALHVPGVAGHAAYPQRARNPIHPLVAALAELAAAPLDAGTEAFEPSCLQVTTVDVGNTAANVVPASAEARLNIRFNNSHTGESLAAWVRGVVGRHAPEASVACTVGAEPFLAPRPFAARLAATVARVTGVAPALSTGGGTSDARFIAPHAPVAEFGLVGASMHAADERVAVADLELLTDVYAALLADFLP